MIDCRTPALLRSYSSSFRVVQIERSVGTLLKVKALRSFSISFLRPAAYQSRSRIIKTLDPQKLGSVGQQMFDLSGIERPGFIIPSKFSVQVAYGSQKRPKYTGIPFPQGTIGTLYYRRPHPEESPISGGLRFRILPDATKFNDGVDLIGPDGLVWQKHLCNLVKGKQWLPILEILVEESLVDEDIVNDLQKLPFKPKGIVNYHYELSQPFIIDFERSGSFSRMFITRTSIHSVSWQGFQSLYRHHRNNLDSIPPYTGRILVRFEIGSTPSMGPGLVLRTLEVLKPVECLHPAYDFLRRPVPGELLSRSKHFGSESALPLIHSLRSRENGKAVAEFAGIPWP